jgi:FkbM family methyltransferase
VTRTAWGDWLEVEPRRFIGGNIYMRAVHEPAVCEALWRLAGPGERAVDVGANVGVMTSLLSKRVGAAGRVTSFEPHPALLRQLQRNVARWGARPIEVFGQAVSSRRGQVYLEEGDWFAVNEGTSSVHPLPLPHALPVPAIRLDDVLDGCAVLKLDVEGHELEVLLGAEKLLRSGRVRDIVFESTWAYPGGAHELLAGCGYELFDVVESFWRPLLVKPTRRAAEPGKMGNYLATREAARARGVMRACGWRVLWPI